MADYAEEEIVENPTLRAAYNLAPLHQNQPLRWDYEVDLIGEKIYDYNKVIHLCEVCELPILVYGRMLPCKHIFCFDCARKCDKFCRRCNGKVEKLEKSALGTVFVCTHGAPKHSTNGCRRTYLSRRDLQSHISHRHLPKPSSSSSKAPVTTPSVQPAPNQLPLTQQQAAQQAAQKPSVAPAHLSPSHPQTSVLPGLGLLGPAVSSHAPATNLQGVTQQSSPVTPLIPGLGDIRPVASVAQPNIGHGSPLLPPGPSPNPMPQPVGTTIQQGMGNAMPQDMGSSMSQGMGRSMSPGLRNIMSQGMGNPASHGMGNMMSQGMGNTLSPGMGGAGYPQSVNPMSQGINNMSPGMGGALSPGMGGSLPQGLGMPYSAASNNPDIYRPLDMPSMGQQHQPQQHPPPQQQQQQAMGLGSPHLQSGQNMPSYGHSSQFPVSTAMLQPLGSQQMTSSMAGRMHPTPLSHQHSQMPISQPLDSFNKSQSMSSAVPTSQSRTNVNLITVPIQDEGQYRPIPYVNPAMAPQNNPNFPPARPNIAGQSQTFSQLAMTSSSAFSPMGNQPQNQNLAGTSSSSGMSFNQISGLRTSTPGMMVNPRPGLTANIHPNMPRALAGVMQAAMNIARAQGGGLMPTPGSVGQGVGNRFPSGRWASPRVIQPRMTQGQQRPRTEGQFNQGPYYN